jgi:hypothetical protein
LLGADRRARSAITDRFMANDRGLGSAYSAEKLGSPFVMAGLDLAPKARDSLHAIVEATFLTSA